MDSDSSFSMKQQDVFKHYTNVANRYDELYGFTYSYLPAFVIKHLQLKPDDLLADIGGGTGALTHIVGKEAGLNNPPFCVEPNAEMLRVAESRGGLTPCCATAEGFFTDHAKLNLVKCNKIVINECAHLFPDLAAVLRKAYEYLPADGLLALFSRSSQSDFPQWQTMAKAFSLSVDEFNTHLTNAGFKVEMVREVGVTQMKKSQLYDKLRKRMFTTLHKFSDEEIEEGLKELDRDWFPGKADSDLVEVRDSFQVFIASK